MGRLGLAAHAGPAVVWGVDVWGVDGGAEGTGRYLTAGLAADAEVRFVVSLRFELGVQGVVNVNPAVTAAGGGGVVRVRLGE